MKKAASIIVLAIGAQLSQAQEYGGMVAAAAEFSAIIMLIKGLIILAGAHACGYAIVQAVRASNERGQEDKTFATNLALFIVGVCMISVGLSISVASNTLFGSDGKSEIAQDLVQNVSLNPAAMESFIQQSSVFQSESLQGQVQQRILQILMMAVMAGGWYALWRGFRIARIALTAGSDMGGTSLAHRQSAIWGHIIGGIALINIESTLGIGANFGRILLTAIAP